MFSSSRAAEPAVRHLLSESFATLLDERPDAYARMCARLGSRRVEIRVERERFTVECQEGQARVIAGSEAPDVVIATSRRAILDVLDARQTLHQAVLADDLRVIGQLEILVELHDALISYVHGAVRSPSFVELLGRFREEVAR